VATTPPLIAHVIYRLDVGGLENGLVNIINGLPVDEFRHAIVCLAGYSDFRARIRRPDVAVYSLDKRPGKDPGMYLRLWRLLRQLRPAIVHTRNLGTVDLQWVAWSSGIAVRVHGEHGWDASDPLGRDPKNLRIRRLCRRVIGRYVAMSQDLADWLRAQVGVRPERIRQIYNGVDIARFSAACELPADLPWAGANLRPFVFGTVGRLDPVKRQALLLQSFAEVRQAQPQNLRERLRLLVVGDGPMREQLLEQARTLGIEAAVWFTGARRDVPELMRAMDVFVLPSMNEGISNTILEAMASGLPVIAARVGGNPELIRSGVSGVLYDDAKPAGLVEAMSSYVRDPALGQQHGCAGRTRVVNDFSLAAMVSNYLHLYRELMAEAN
jgi:sugar transferase (PEP-CTERM/EpsH1 system associated)